MLIDLSVPLNESTPIYPGDPEIGIRSIAEFDKDGYRVHHVSFGTHSGTHIDAPSHAVKNGKNLDQFPLEKFTGKGIYIKVSEEFTLESLEKADISAGSIVVFHTGMSDKYHDPTYFENYPIITEEIAQYLVDKRVKIIGVDMCSPDKEPFLVHKILLENDVLIIENLTNLHALADKSFRIYAFPMNLEIDGAPVRVVAEVY